LHHGDELGRVQLALPGLHAALDSLAAVAVALELGIPFAKAADALASFEGVDRRLSRRGNVGGVEVIDDYAHHPTEIIATLAALRQGFGARRVIALFQPHRYSRIAALRDDFARCFNDADVVLACPVHAAGEKPIPGVDTGSLVEAMRSHGHRAVEEVDGTEAAAARAVELSEPGDLIVTLGAGDVTQAASLIVSALQAEEEAG
jgi:UDP-N-acetylmuramate--alanine ligase